MSDYSQNLSPQPSSDLKDFDRLVGTWKQAGGIEGEIIYEWMEGRFFLIQRVNLDHEGHLIKGLEVIGPLQLFGEEPSTDIKSRFYSALDGMTLDYVYEIAGDTLTIWGGKRGSPAYYKGQFSEDGNTLTGAWVYPVGRVRSGLDPGKVIQPSANVPHICSVKSAGRKFRLDQRG